MRMPVNGDLKRDEQLSDKLLIETHVNVCYRAVKSVVRLG